MLANLVYTEVYLRQPHVYREICLRLWKEFKVYLGKVYFRNMNVHLSMYPTNVTPSAINVTSPV
jgi:hypothetical protein